MLALERRVGEYMNLCAYFMCVWLCVTLSFSVCVCVCVCVCVHVCFVCVSV